MPPLGSITRENQSESFVREFDKPNQHKPGTRLLVRAFDYGNGFEIVKEAERLENFTYYQVEIKEIVTPKVGNQLRDYYSLPPNFVTFISGSSVGI